MKKPPRKKFLKKPDDGRDWTHEELIAMPAEQLRAVFDEKREVREFAKVQKLDVQFERAFRLAAERNIAGLRNELVGLLLERLNDVNNELLIQAINRVRRGRARDRRRRGRTPLKTLGKLNIHEQRAQVMWLVDEDLVETFGHTYSDPILLDFIRDNGGLPKLFSADPRKKPGLVRSLSRGRTEAGLEKLKPAKRKPPVT